MLKLSITLSVVLSDTSNKMPCCEVLPAAPDEKWLSANVRKKRKLMPILCLSFGMHEALDDGCIGVRNDPDVMAVGVKLTF